MAATKTDLQVEDLKLSEEMNKFPMLARYDLGMQELFSQVFAGQVILAPAERAFELFVDQSKEKLKFPFISLFPVNGYTRNLRNFAASNIGQPVYRQAPIYDDDTLKYKGQSLVMQNFYQLLYFDIPYQIECWSIDRSEALQLVQELMFWLTSQGQIKVSYKGNTLTCNITIDDTITDNSTYTEYANIGNLYRFTLTITVNAPVLRTTNYLNITNADLTVDLEKGE